ncbi:hypothetical protein BT96DRAFT_1005416 [Gymnopus androsaceus JB14]|uniref:Uncharacterized protein n=1 Tax=Gymnopus androsaceus JB14 TaxID=1447944 RepID=A0A6A4GP76_9AGAR|nr:hypothetical protein BT96DRAFT_1005416 [Gymnopus androsaceus JB14]
MSRERSKLNESFLLLSGFFAARVRCFRIHPLDSVAAPLPPTDVSCEPRTHKLTDLSKSIPEQSPNLLSLDAHLTQAQHAWYRNDEDVLIVVWWFLCNLRLTVVAPNSSQNQQRAFLIYSSRVSLVVSLCFQSPGVSTKVDVSRCLPKKSSP